MFGNYVVKNHTFARWTRKKFVQKNVIDNIIFTFPLR